MFLIKHLPSQPSVIKTLILNVSFIPIQIATAFRCFHPPKDLRYSLYPQASMFSCSNPDRLKCFFVFFFSACWLGMRALPSVARGLPDWLDSFRGKRAECFWGLEFECETLGDAAAFPANNTHFEEFAHSRKSTKSVFFFFFCPCWGETLHRNAKRLFAGVIAPGLGIQPQNCTVRTWKPPHLNIAEVTASTVWERGLNSIVSWLYSV